MQAYEQCRAELAEQLGIDPAAETVEVYLAALRDQSASSAARLPVVTSTFISRDREVAQLDAALSQPGLVTVAGRGGVGKSRLTVRVAAARRDFVGGRLWVSLAPVAEDALVASTVALEVGVALGTDDATAVLAEHLAPLGRVLLVLDGCEIVVDGVASLATALLANCPHLTIVVTSRVPLSLEGERVVTVEPLDAPMSDDPAALLASAQVRILIDRVHDSGGDLQVDERLAPHVALLLGQCGGLPLALELVAAQLSAMPVGDLLDHLSDVLVDGEDRLRRVVRGSYALLDDDEAAVYRRLAVLDGPVGLPLIRAVVSAARSRRFGWFASCVSSPRAVCWPLIAPARDGAITRTTTCIALRANCSSRVARACCVRSTCRRGARCITRRRTGLTGWLPRSSHRHARFDSFAVRRGDAGQN